MKNRKPIEVLTRAHLSELGEVRHDVQTSKQIGSWLIEIKVNGKLNQAQKVFSAEDLPLATKAMLLTEHVLGNYSAYTRAATQGGGRAHKPRPVTNLAAH